MKTHCGMLTWDFYVTRFGNDEKRLALARDTWNENYAGVVGDHLDPRIPREDLRALRDGLSGVEGFVNDHLAHRSSTAHLAPPTVTFADLHTGIDLVGSVWRKYNGLVTGYM